MAKLISARHGDYKGESLSEEGREQIARLAESIHEALGDIPYFMVSSTVPRAVQSSQIIADRLGIASFETEEYICDPMDVPSGNKRGTFLADRNFDKMMGMVYAWDEKAEGALIIVSHGHIAEIMADMFGSKYGIDVTEYNLEKGEAVYVDPDTKSHRLLPGK